MSQSIPRTLDFAQNGIVRGLHLGAQIYVEHHGDILVDTAIGRARDGVAMTRDSILFWLSAGKPITSVAIAQLVEKGKLHLDARIVDFIPEFAEHGKDEITVRHILTHTGGFRTGDLVPDNLPWSETIQRICESRLEPRWEVGKKAGYHSIGSWYILGEIIRIVDGRMPGLYAREEIFLPLGMVDSWLGMTTEEYASHESQLGWHYDTSGEAPIPLSSWNSRESFTHCKPPSNTCGPAHDLGKFYRTMLNGGELNGHRILSSEYVDTWTTRQRQGLFDNTFKQVVDWGYGFCINSRHYGVEILPYGYGPYASINTFGHSGSQSSAAFADPERDLVVVVLFNGRPGEDKHQPRIRQTLALLYEDLGLV